MVVSEGTWEVLSEDTAGMAWHTGSEACMTTAQVACLADGDSWHETDERCITAEETACTSDDDVWDIHTSVCMTPIEAACGGSASDTYYDLTEDTCWVKSLVDNSCDDACNGLDSSLNGVGMDCVSGGWNDCGSGGCGPSGAPEADDCLICRRILEDSEAICNAVEDINYAPYVAGDRCNYRLGIDQVCDISSNSKERICKCQIPLP